MFKISVANFQSIETEEVEICGFTTITGKSNIGKTALLRAISSSIFNKPVGGFARDPKKPIIVQVSGPGVDYTWKKGEKGINQYLVGDKLFDKCGTESILDICPDLFKSIKVGDKDSYPWYASQFSPLFLIDETSGKISEFFAEFCRIGLINKAIKLANSRKKEYDMIAKHLEEEVRQITEQLSKFKSLEKYKFIIPELEAQKASIEEFEYNIERRSGYEVKISSSRKSLAALGVVSRTSIPEDREITGLVDGYRTVHMLETKHEHAVYKYYSLEAVQDARVPEPPEMPALVVLEKASKLQKFVKNKVVPQLPTIPSKDAYVEIRSFQERLDKLYDSFVSLNTKLKGIKYDNPEREYYQYKIMLEKERSTRIQNQIRVLIGQIRDVEEQLNAIPKCPSCDRVLDPTHIHHTSGVGGSAGNSGLL